MPGDTRRVGATSDAIENRNMNMNMNMNMSIPENDNLDVFRWAIIILMVLTL